MIVVPPKNTVFKRSGKMSNAYAYAKELPMTILDYAGVEYPKSKFKGRKITPPSGVSLRPFLAGEESSPRTEEEPVVFELFGNAYVVAGDYKAIRVRPGMWGDGKWHLYDIKKDSGRDESPRGRPAEAAPEDDRHLRALRQRKGARAGVRRLEPVGKHVMGESM
jgi:arylsulfatase